MPRSGARLRSDPMPTSRSPGRPGDNDSARPRTHASIAWAAEPRSGKSNASRRAIADRRRRCRIDSRSSACATSATQALDVQRPEWDRRVSARSGSLISTRPCAWVTEWFRSTRRSRGASPPPRDASLDVRTAARDATRHPSNARDGASRRIELWNGNIEPRGAAARASQTHRPRASRLARGGHPCRSSSRCAAAARAKTSPQRDPQCVGREHLRRPGRVGGARRLTCDYPQAVGASTAPPNRRLRLA